MRRAQFPIGHAGTLPAQDNARLTVGDVNLDLLERPAGEEGRSGADEGDQAAVGQPGSHADQVLLGNPDIDHPVRELSLEHGEIA